MAILLIRKYPDPVVREATRPVETINREVKSIIKSMIETMRDAPGVGLAANQIGVQKSIITVAIDDRDEVFINPSIVWKSEETKIDEEGCLSLVPGVHIPVERSVKIKLKAIDRRGRPVEMEAEGLLARIFQHEIDHLNGVLIIDRVAPQVRKKALREMSELFMAP